MIDDLSDCNDLNIERSTMNSELTNCAMTMTTKRSGEGQREESCNLDSHGVLFALTALL